MPVLFSVDFEYTNSDPDLTYPMEVGVVAAEFNPTSMTVGNMEGTFTSRFHVPDHAKISPWVAEQQSELLRECRDFGEEKSEARKVALRRFIDSYTIKYGGVGGFVVGWGVFMDFLLLRRLCPKSHIGYRPIELGDFVSAVHGNMSTDDDAILASLDIKREKRHEAFDDARVQLELARKIFLKTHLMALMRR